MKQFEDDAIITTNPAPKKVIKRQRNVGRKGTIKINKLQVSKQEQNKEDYRRNKKVSKNTAYSK
ncbi:MAG: hypothetical protein IJS47_06330 [Clostridia bacterium]|nr:hypothetical protein [Clostridia bacterium]